MVLPIAQLGENALRIKCEIVKVFDEQLRQLCADMAETMYNAKGIGIAGPQVNKPKRIFIMDVHENREWQEFINPKIVEKSQEKKSFEEGCLSIPQFLYPVSRPASVTISFQDYYGNSLEETFSGLAAVCVQHEMDHLKGKLFIDYIPKKAKLEAMQKMLAANFAKKIVEKELKI